MVWIGLVGLFRTGLVWLDLDGYVFGFGGEKLAFRTDLVPLGLVLFKCGLDWSSWFSLDWFGLAWFRRVWLGLIREFGGLFMMRSVLFVDNFVTLYLVVGGIFVI